MSASSKKKLRREQIAAEQTERQQAAKKEMKKMKIYSAIFFVVIALMVAVVVFSFINKSGIFERNIDALAVGEEPISAVELNIHYIDAITNFYNQYGSAISMLGLDPTKPLDAQDFGPNDGTWADYFLDMAKNNIRSTYAVYNTAVASGYKLQNDDIVAFEESMEEVKDAAAAQGYTNVDKYMKAVYGNGATFEDYCRVSEVMMIASAFRRDVQESMNYTDDAIAAKDKEDPIIYNSYDYNTYLVSGSHYLKGGALDAEGNVVYSDENKKDAVAAAEVDAKALTEGTYATAEEFNAAIAALEINKEKTVSSTSNDAVSGGSLDATMKEWLTDSSRKPGDITYIERTATNDDKTEVTGYNVIYFRGVNDNQFPLANVRHILVAFEGGTLDPNTNTTTYSEPEKQQAKLEAQALLDQWSAGAATEDSFAALATERTDDPGSKEEGGLYEDVYPGQMVQPFEDWCFDEAREPGDVGLVETTYGYHVMYYVGDSETTNRTHMIESDLVNADMEKWFEDLLIQNPLVERNLSRVKKDLVLAGF